MNTNTPSLSHMQGRTVCVRLPGVPVGKGRPKFVRATGVAFTPLRTRTYESSLRIAAGEVMNGAAPIVGPVAVDVVATFPIPKSWPKKRQARAAAGLEYATGKPDADNLLKALDALNEIVWRDDAQIAEAKIVKRYGLIAELVITVIALSEPCVETPSSADA